MPRKRSQKIDWRKLPRKPAEDRRDCQTCIRFTRAELDALRAAADLAGLSLADFVIVRALNRSRPGK